MAVLQEVVRVLTIRSQTQGIDETTSSLNKLAGAEAQVAVQSDNVTKASISTTNALDRLQRSIDSEYRSQQSLSSAATVLSRARGQGIIDMNEEQRLLGLATSKYADLGHGAEVNAAQMLALTHVARSMTEQIAMGVNPVQALTAQISHLSFIMTSEGGLVGAFKSLGVLIAPFVPLLLGIGAAAGSVALIFAGMTTKINETAKTQVNFGEVFKATIQVAAEDIGKFFKPAVNNLAIWWKQFVDWISPTFKQVGDDIINVFSTAFNIVKDTWSLLPDAFASIFTKAMNGAIDIVQNSINGIIGPVNNLLSAAHLPTIANADLSGFKGKPSNADTQLGSIVSRDVASGMSADPLGQFFGQVSTKAQELAVADATDKMSKSMKAANDNVKLLKDGLKDLGGVTDIVAKSQKEMVNNALGSFANLSGAFSKLFQDNKALAASTAILQGLQGVAYAIGSGPPPWNLINAAAVGIQAAANVAQILATNQNSTSMPTGVGASSATPTASVGAASTPSSAINLTIRGSGNISIDDIAKQLQQSIADGGQSGLIKVIRAA
jgi:hypothetical protein